jgi:hypothetical protein
MTEDHIDPARIDGEAVDGRLTLSFSSGDGQVGVSPAATAPPLDETQPALELSVRTDDGAGQVDVELSTVEAVALVDEIEAELKRLQEAAR